MKTLNMVRMEHLLIKYINLLYHFSVGGRKLKLGLDHEILVDGEESVIPVHNERFTVHKASSHWSLGRFIIFKLYAYNNQLVLVLKSVFEIFCSLVFYS